MPTKKKSTKSKKATAASGTSPLASAVVAAAKAAGISQASVRTALNAFLLATAKEVKAGHRIVLRGFGTFTSRTIKGRTVTIPDGRRVKYATRTKLAFRSALKL